MLKNLDNFKSKNYFKKLDKLIVYKENVIMLIVCIKQQVIKKLAFNQIL